MHLEKCMHSVLDRNLDRKKCELVHNCLSEDPVAVALHPSGYQLLIGFNKSVKMVSVLLHRPLCCEEGWADLRIQHS